MMRASARLLRQGALMRCRMRAWCGAEVSGGQDSADGARAQAVSQPDEFALDAPVAPGWILVGQTHHDVADLITDWWAARPVRISPLLPDQAAVPCQQRGGGNQAVQPQPRGSRRAKADKTARSGQEGRTLAT